MDEDILGMILTFVAGMSVLGCLTTVVLTMIKRRTQHLPNSELGRRLDDISERLNHIDGAIDTMAVEVERISEAQRFTARVLAERTSTPAAALPELGRVGSTTPH